MNTRRITIATLLTAGLLVTLASGCGYIFTSTGPLQTESRTVELADAESVDVDLRMGAGQLDIEGGADALMEAEFTYNVPEWEPIVDYSVSGGQGELTVRQPDVEQLGLDDYRYEWDLRFAEDVPLDLDVDLGAGQSTLDLAALSLTGLTVEIGAGQTTVDLNRAWEQDLDVEIRGGVGEATIYLPADVGVRAEVAGALGDLNVTGLSREDDGYVNDAFGETEATLTLDIEGGIGQINLEVIE